MEDVKLDLQVLCSQGERPYWLWLFQDFIDHMQYSRAVSENTIRAYVYDLGQLVRFLLLRGLDPRKARLRHLDAFVVSLGKGQALKKRTIARKVHVVKAFYRWLYRVDEIGVDVSKQLDPPRISRGLPEYLTAEQQELLLEHFDVDTGGKSNVGRWIRARNKVIVLTFLDAGLRVSELTRAKVSGLDPGNNYLRILGKGEREAEVFLSDRLTRALTYYVSETRPHLLRMGSVFKRGKRYVVYKNCNGKPKFVGSWQSRGEAEAMLYENNGPDPGFLFVSKRGQKMVERHIAKLLGEAGKALGFRVHPHLLRHTFATNLRSKGCDLLTLREALRHVDVSTTQIYAHLSNRDYKAQMSGFLN